MQKCVNVSREHFFSNKNGFLKKFKYTHVHTQKVWLFKNSSRNLNTATHLVVLKTEVSGKMKK